MNLVNGDGWTFEGEVMHQGQQVLHSSFFLLFFIVMPAGYTSLFTLRASMMLFLLFGQIWYLLLLMLLFLFFFFLPLHQNIKRKEEEVLVSWQFVKILIYLIVFLANNKNLTDF